MKRTDWLGLLATIGFAAGVTFFIMKNAKAAEIEGMAKLSHTTDIFRGCPFRCEVDEPQLDALTGGVTITAGKRRRWEIDLTHGLKWVDRGKSQQATEFEVRMYPGRNRTVLR